MTDIPQDAPGSNRLPPLPGEADADAVLARRLRRLRMAAQVTQQQLASQMSGNGYQMHQTTIAKIEAGERPVSIGEAVALALVLGVGLQDLVTEPDLDELAEALAAAARCQQRLQVEKEKQAEADAAAEAAQRRVRQAHSELIGAERKVKSIRSRQGQG